MKNFFSILCVLIIASAGGECIAGGAPKGKAVLREGFLLNGLDGRIHSSEGGGGRKWFFTPFETISDGRNTVKAGTPLEILRSSVLEKLVKAGDGNIGSYRLWGKLAQYHEKNYVYLSYFLPVIDKPQSPVRDTNVPVIIPENVMAMLRPKRVVNLAGIRKGLAVDSDGVIVDRTGFLRKVDNKFYFDFEAMGRNVGRQSFELLKCDFLEIMNSRQSVSPDPVRFRISAILTRFKGSYYLLIQRAVVAYSYGNFAR